ncbi:MAG: glycoside hydrolase family 2 TIM barrel-domain containing protein [Lewinella sp.]|uniref:glycoside hydrolase family 2 TIM barrel-domain containing protein n=1 Tax=Lewinella sp. TaxID=2004506 RepID=UPI003D6A4A55
MLPEKSFLFLFVLLVGMLSLDAQNRTIVTLSEGWKFRKGETKDAHTVGIKDAAWQTVSVPHDWAIAGPFILDGNGSTGKLPWQGQAWYRRDLVIPAAAAGQRMYLIFDGVMAFPKVYINGKLAGEWDYGYNSFSVDITDFVTPGGKNVLAVHADTRSFDSRWYPGAGIYRKVELLTVAPVHVDIWGTYVTTPVVKPHYADVRVSTKVNNFTAERANITVEHQVLSDGGQVVAKGDFEKWINAGQQSTLESTLTVLDPVRWDVDQPYLYRLVTKVRKDGEIVDEYITNFGVRTIRFDPDHGFYLNDRRVQLKGVNLHHDHGPLGAAFYPRAMERQLEIMKSMGVNAIRNSHNTAAPELLEMCDRMGLLFFNEAFDKYDAKAAILEDTDFETFAQRNVHNFVVRDRNHPSVFLWSVGNEIPDVQNNDNNGFQRLHTMVNYVRKYDPTRPVTLVNDQLDNAARRHFDYYDVHSWNYGRRYRLARQMEPNKSVIISESASTLSTRGFYEFPLPDDKTAFTKSLQVSSYDLNAPWWAEIADDDFMWQQDESYIAGEFVWTGFDYLGEPTPYDNKTVKEMGFTDEAAARSSYFGIVDLVGIPKDRYYLYKSYWLPEENMIHILPHWNWPERVGENVPVFVYTNGDEAELFLNGESQGRRSKQPKSDNSVDRFRLMWNDVVYQPGELKVVAYKAGRKIGEQTLKTAGKATQLRLTPDRRRLHANDQDLSYVLVEALDAEGNLAPLAMDKISLSLVGEGSIAGVGNGNPQSFAPFQAQEVELFYGKAMIILKSGQEPGKMTLKASADKLDAATVVIGAE